MEPIWGFILYLVLDVIVALIARARGLAWSFFLIATPVLGLGMSVLGAGASGGEGSATALMGFGSLFISLLFALGMKSKARRLEDGQVVAGYKKCPDCAEQVREEARKCKHCGSTLPVLE